ncbi:MAG TPA: amidohydrolase family protein [Acidimicrobiales bacterium]
MVVDAHTHLLPPRLNAAVRAFFAARGATAWAYPNDHAETLAMVAREGVEEVWTLPYAHKPGAAVGLNEASAATVAQFADGPVHVVGGATVHPGDDHPVDIVADAVDHLGLRVLKLHCSVGRYALDDQRLAPVLRFAAERRLPVVVHLGRREDGRTELAELPELDRVADAHPDLVVVLAHCGHHAGPSALDILDRHANVHADLTPVSGDPVAVPAEHVRALADRFLFGSDTPNTPRTVTQNLEHVLSFGLDAAAEAAVLGGNARRLIAAVEA